MSRAESLAEAIRDEAEKNLIIQRFKRMAFLGRSIVLPAGSVRDASIDVGQSGDFSCEEFTAKIVPSSPNTTTGVSIEIWDNQKANLTDGPIALETIASPGYGISRVNPRKFEHTFERSGKIKITLVNESTETQTVKFCFSGTRLA